MTQNEVRAIAKDVRTEKSWEFYKWQFLVAWLFCLYVNAKRGKGKPAKKPSDFVKPPKEGGRSYPDSKTLKAKLMNSFSMFGIEVKK